MSKGTKKSIITKVVKAREKLRYKYSYSDSVKEVKMILDNIIDEAYMSYDTEENMPEGLAQM